MSDPKAAIVADWKKGIAASKSSRKAIYTAASALVGLVASQPAVARLNELCAKFGLEAVDAVCSVPQEQITIATGALLAAGLDWLLQFGRNYLKHRLGIPLP